MVLRQYFPRLHRHDFKFFIPLPVFIIFLFNHCNLYQKLLVLFKFESYKSSSLSRLVCSFVFLFYSISSYFFLFQCLKLNLKLNLLLPLSVNRTITRLKPHVHSTDYLLLTFSHKDPLTFGRKIIRRS